jgi:hypothetical protein
MAGAGAREAPNAQLREGDFVNVVATVNVTRTIGCCVPWGEKEMLAIYNSKRRTGPKKSAVRS